MSPVDKKNYPRFNICLLRFSCSLKLDYFIQSSGNVGSAFSVARSALDVNDSLIGSITLNFSADLWNFLSTTHH